MKAGYIPKLTCDKHKGNYGRVAVIGGSFEYTGAPYFAAYTALRIGADLSHVFCMKSAGIPIKCYSPELIVHPVLPEPDEFDYIPKALESVKKWFDAVDVFIIGPGLGRNQATLDFTEQFIEYLKSTDTTKPIILDGDALFLVSTKPNLVYGCHNFILTPNGGEYMRLCNAVQLKPDTPVLQLAKAMNVFIFAKGHVDRFSDGQKVMEHTIKDQCPKRCGGQGDIFAGMLGVFASYAPKDFFGASATASWIMKTYAQLTFKCHNRRMIAEDIIAQISAGGIQF